MRGASNKREEEEKNNNEEEKNNNEEGKRRIETEEKIKIVDLTSIKIHQAMFQGYPTSSIDQFSTTDLAICLGVTLSSKILPATSKVASRE